jgi:hypothetical protein
MDRKDRIPRDMIGGRGAREKHSLEIGSNLDLLLSFVLFHCFASRVKQIP